MNPFQMENEEYKGTRSLREYPFANLKRESFTAKMRPFAAPNDFKSPEKPSPSKIKKNVQKVEQILLNITTFVLSFPQKSFNPVRNNFMSSLRSPAFTIVCNGHS